MKILLSTANSTSECSAQDLVHLGSKATNHRRDSDDQRSRSHFFSNVHCLPTSMLLVVYQCYFQCYWLFAIFCFQLATRLVSFLPTGPVGVAAL